MLIEDSLTQAITVNHQVTLKKAETETIYDESSVQTFSDYVRIYKAARAGKAQNQIIWENPPEPLEDDNQNQVIAAYKKFMDHMRRGFTKPMRGTKSEKIKALEEEIKRLYAKLSEVMSNEKLSDSIKESQKQAIKAQIAGLTQELAEVLLLPADEELDLGGEAGGSGGEAGSSGGEAGGSGGEASGSGGEVSGSGGEAGGSDGEAGGSGGEVSGSDDPYAGILGGGPIEQEYLKATREQKILRSEGLPDEKELNILDWLFLRKLGIR